MSQNIQYTTTPQHAKQGRKKTSVLSVIFAIFASLAFIAALAVVAYMWFMPSILPFLSHQESQIQQSESPTFEGWNAMLGEESSTYSSIGTLVYNKAQNQAEFIRAMDEEAAAHDGFPTPLIAEYDSVLLHCPIHVHDLEGILFHQASFESALVLSTKLPYADVEKMEENPDYEIAEEQPEGDEYIRALGLHLWREDEPTEMDTSIDVGAEAYTQVYAPVTGTVVLVRTYDLYDTCEDYEIHIQPDGRPDLDVVEIHVTELSVKPGDKVEGGVTPIARVRDLAAEDITDIQLGFYTKEGHGNHTHVQINDANYPEYRETRLKDAFKVE